MKTITLFLILILTISFAAIAQKPVKGEYQMSFGVWNNNGFAILKHFRSDLVAYRYGATGNFNYQKSEGDQFTGPGFVYSNTSLSLNYGFSGGIQRSFEGIEKLEPYIGFDIVLSSQYSKSQSRSEVMFDDPYYGYERGDHTFNTSIRGFAPGITFRPMLGVNYYITKKLAVGAEYQVSFISANYAFRGINKSEVRRYGFDYPTQTTYTSPGFTFRNSFSGYGGITVSFSFK